MRLSACIIARDEAARLPACLAALEFCDEVLVVDSGSSDETVSIAQAAGARVIANPWPGFAAQRNFAIDNARGEWVLEVDADERITPALALEIVRFLDSDAAAFDIAALPLRNIFLGRPLGPASKYPEYRRRLFRRDRYRHDERRTVHEALVPHGPIHPFEHDLEHVLAETAGEAVADAWRYARLEAGQMQLASGAGAFVRGAFVRPAVKLPYRLFVDGGWRDGWRGLTKIAIDCCVDSVVWWRHLLDRRGEERGRSGVSRRHYGATNFRAGSPLQERGQADRRWDGWRRPRAMEPTSRWWATGLRRRSRPLTAGACPRAQRRRARRHACISPGGASERSG